MQNRETEPGSRELFVDQLWRQAEVVVEVQKCHVERESNVVAVSQQS